ncbi:hypothetical protein Ctob_002691 [Chrysochromulina tobinii]|uniref:Exostosin GT47 domain-containing protein n=1 Tax=Chrysochromulina tobinii TaxID=1460289 RepID=A0A0M0J777_9EUKA|nr:hypothetical protein Ctob_002691 [Chrysochromulina tobinii]|eukprot:KOO22078.1 hypothetical protein Ctob_002691 [Chrysochromulina sp. CCMP291]
MGYTYLGLIHSKGDFSAMVRPDAVSDPGALAAQAREEATPAETCRSSLARRMPPKFYMYDGPEFLWGERLAACYHRKYGHAPWAMAKFFKNNTGYTEAGPAPQEDLSHALWLHTSLVRHRHRTKDPSAAMLYVVPAFGSLSEATVAAGCVPMIIGDTIRLPLAPLIAYKNFTVRVPESEFLRDPHAAVNEVLTTALTR